MSDHYLAYLQAHAREVAAERDAERRRADRLARIVAAVRDAHAGCSAETCTTIKAIEGAS